MAITDHQLLDSAKAATAYALLGQLAKPAFEQVQPRAGSRGKVQVKARPTFETGVYLWMFVGP